MSAFSDEIQAHLNAIKTGCDEDCQGALDTLMQLDSPASHEALLSIVDVMQGKKWFCKMLEFLAIRHLVDPVPYIYRVLMDEEPVSFNQITARRMIRRMGIEITDDFVEQILAMNNDNATLFTLLPLLSSNKNNIYWLSRILKQHTNMDVVGQAAYDLALHQDKAAMQPLFDILESTHVAIESQYQVLRAIKYALDHHQSKILLDETRLLKLLQRYLYQIDKNWGHQVARILEALNTPEAQHELEIWRKWNESTDNVRIFR